MILHKSEGSDRFLELPSPTINMGCILKQKADMDAYVKYQGSLLEVKRGRLETALLPGPRIICGTRSLGVSGILPEGMLSFLKISLIRSWLTTPMCLGVVSLVTHMTEIFASRTLCTTTIEMRGLAV